MSDLPLNKKFYSENQRIVFKTIALDHGIFECKFIIRSGPPLLNGQHIHLMDDFGYVKEYLVMEVIYKDRHDSGTVLIVLKQ